MKFQDIAAFHISALFQLILDEPFNIQIGSFLDISSLRLNLGISV
jgi:hypothetical protein